MKMSGSSMTVIVSIFKEFMLKRNDKKELVCLTLCSTQYTKLCKVREFVTVTYGSTSKYEDTFWNHTMSRLS